MTFTGIYYGDRAHAWGSTQFLLTNVPGRYNVNNDEPLGDDHFRYLSCIQYDLEHGEYPRDERASD